MARSRKASACSHATGGEEKVWVEAAAVGVKQGGFVEGMSCQKRVGATGCDPGDAVLGLLWEGMSRAL